MGELRTEAAFPLLALADVRKHFPIREGVLGRVVGQVQAVDGVSLEVHRQEAVALVGESGCGKSTLARLALKLLAPTSGRIVLEGEDITHLGASRMRPFRRDLQIVFQDPYSSLNPRMAAKAIVREPLDNYGIGGRHERRDRVEYLFGRVGLNKEHLAKYPGELSGGQRQRLGIARALATAPMLIVCDEAIASLDVSVRAQIINLLVDLQDEFGLSYLFITHDIGVVQHVSHRVGVMYLGKVVELADASALFRKALHPYTTALFASVLPPVVGARRGRSALAGDVPSPVNPPSGCRFRTRCPLKVARCETEEPLLRAVGSGQSVACHVVG